MVGLYYKYIIDAHAPVTCRPSRSSAMHPKPASDLVLWSVTSHKRMDLVWPWGIAGVGACVCGGVGGLTSHTSTSSCVHGICVDVETGKS